METVEIAIDKRSFEATALHILSRLLPNLLSDLLLTIPASIAESLGQIVQSVIRLDGGQRVAGALPFSADANEFLRSFASGDMSGNSGRSILVQDLRVQAVSLEPRSRHLGLLRESIEALRNNWPNDFDLLPSPGAESKSLLFERLFGSPDRQFPSSSTNDATGFRETPSLVNFQANANDAEARIRVVVDVFLSASREPGDPPGFEPQGVVQSVFFDFRAHARLEAFDRGVLADTVFFRAPDGTRVRAQTSRQNARERLLGVPAVVPFTSLALTLDRIVLDSEKPLAFRDSLLHQDGEHGGTILAPGIIREDLFGYLCYGSRPRTSMSTLPRFAGIIRIVQAAVSERLPAELNELLSMLYDGLFNSLGPLHGVNLSPHFPRNDDRASRAPDPTDRSNDCRFFLDERWFLWYFGIAVTPSQVRLNIQFAQPSAFGWRPRQFCGLPTETLSDCYPRVQVLDNPQNPLQVSVQRWMRFFESPNELPMSRRVVVLAAFEFLASALCRVIDEFLDYGLSAAGSALRVLERKKPISYTDPRTSPTTRLSPEAYWNIVRRDAQHWLDFQADGGSGPFFSASAVEQHFSFAIPFSGMTIRRYAQSSIGRFLGSPWADVDFVYQGFLDFERALSRGERLPRDWPVNESGRWMLRSLRALARGEVPPPTEEERRENAGRLEWFYRTLECDWLTNDVASGVDAALRNTGRRAQYPSEEALRESVRLERQERFVNICRIAALDLAPDDEFSVASAQRLLRESVVPTMRRLPFVLRTFQSIWRVHIDRFWAPSGLGEFQGSPFPLAVLSFLEVNHTVARGAYPGHTRGSFEPDAFLRSGAFTWAERVPTSDVLSPLCRFKLGVQGDMDVALPVDLGDFHADLGLTIGFRTQYANAEPRRAGQFYPELVDPVVGDPSTHPVEPHRVPGLVGLNLELNAHSLLAVEQIQGQYLWLYQPLAEALLWILGWRGDVGASIWRSILGSVTLPSGVFVGVPTSGDDRQSSEVARSSFELTVADVARRLVELLDGLLGEPLWTWISPEYRFVPRDLGFESSTSSSGVIVGVDLVPPAIIQFFYRQRSMRQNRPQLRLASVSQQFPRGLSIRFLGGSSCDHMGEPYAVIEVEVRNPDPVLPVTLFGVTLELRSGLSGEEGTWIEELISATSIYQWQPGRGIPESISTVSPSGRTVFVVLVSLRPIWSEYLNASGFSVARSFGFEPLIQESVPSPLPPQLLGGLPGVRPLVSQFDRLRSASALRLSLRSSFGVEQVVLNDPVRPMLDRLREWSSPESIARLRDLCRLSGSVPRPEDLLMRPNLSDALQRDRWEAYLSGAISSEHSTTAGSRLLEQYVAEELESRFLGGDPSFVEPMSVIDSLMQERKLQFDLRSVSSDAIPARRGASLMDQVVDVESVERLYDRDVFSAVLTAALATKKSV